MANQIGGNQIGGADIWDHLKFDSINEEAYIEVHGKKINLTIDQIRCQECVKIALLGIVSPKCAHFQTSRDSFSPVPSQNLQQEAWFSLASQAMQAVPRVEEELCLKMENLSAMDMEE